MTLSVASQYKLEDTLRLLLDDPYDRMLYLPLEYILKVRSLL